MWIELTSTENNGYKFFMNSNFMEAFWRHPEDKLTIICVTTPDIDGNQYYCKETPEEIMQKIKEAQNG